MELIEMRCKASKEIKKIFDGVRKVKGDDIDQAIKESMILYIERNAKKMINLEKLREAL
jgi:hypothetical protein